MNLEEAIYKRQSIRSYNDVPIDEETLNELVDFIDNAKPLNPDIGWSYDIVSQQNISSMMRWEAPYYLILFSDKKDNYLENIGFIFQQVDLFLQSREIGTCWIGMAKPKGYEKKNPDHSFIIAISFGRSSKPIHRDFSEFRRKRLEEISDEVDERLIPAQFAPSSTNSQPWHFIHNDDGSYSVYRINRGFLRNRFMSRWNRIDIGIALAHLYIANKDTFSFYIDDKPAELNNYFYGGNFRI